MRTPDTSRPLPAVVQPLQPTSLDPYPERSGAVTGVRQTADIIHLPTQTPDTDWWADDPFVVAASLEPEPCPAGMGRWPVASILIACLAQVLLGAAMAAHYVPAVVGAVVAVAVLVCSLLLITAQTIAQAVGRDEVY